MVNSCYVLHSLMPAEVAEAVRVTRLSPAVLSPTPLRRHLPNKYRKTTLTVLAKNILGWEKIGPVKIRGLVLLSSPGRKTSGNKCKCV